MVEKEEWCPSCHRQILRIEEWEEVHKKDREYYLECKKRGEYISEEFSNSFECTKCHNLIGGFEFIVSSCGNICFNCSAWKEMYCWRYYKTHYYCNKQECPENGEDLTHYRHPSNCMKGSREDYSEDYREDYLEEYQEDYCVADEDRDGKYCYECGLLPYKCRCEFYESQYQDEERYSSCSEYENDD